jgi:hypothetical protein
MRDFFIGALDKLVAVIVVLGALGVLIAAGGALFAPGGGGLLPALGILIGGTIYVLFIGGFMYPGLGIYHNTKRMAEAMDRAPR